MFVDRDGVVNVPPSEEMRYLRRWEDFEFMDGIVEALALVKGKGFPMFLITNQQGVGKGLMTMEELAALHEAMQAALATQGASFDGIYVATGLKGEDVRRKPSAKMLEEAAAAHQLDLTRSLMIGDHDNDMRAAWAAGARGIRMKGLKAITVPSDYQVENAVALKCLLEQVLRPEPFG